MSIEDLLATAYAEGAIKKKCYKCRRKYYAAENSVYCKPCAEKAIEDFHNLSPEEKERRIKEVSEFLSGIL